jgi:type II secretory pathway component PulM
VLQFMWGALAMANATAALFFLRFFRDTRDRLFALFGGGFLALAINYAVLALVQPSREERHYVYLIRLVAFLLILFGVIDKNRRK